MENNPNKADRAIRKWKALGFVLMALLAVVLAAWLLPGSWRASLLRLAERTGLYQETEHEPVPVRDEAGKILYWTCTMHPWVRAEGPGKCPV